MADRPPLVLGIDIGSSSTKGVLATPSGEVVATASRAHALSQPRPGWVEHDADAIWWAEVCALARELVTDGIEVAAVCVSGIGPCVVPLDSSDRPLRPAILYGIDTRAEREIEELTSAFGADAILARCGLGAHIAGGRAEAALAAAQRAEGVAADAALRDGELLRGAPPVWRVRPRPPLREPVRSALRPRARRLGTRLGR